MRCSISIVLFVLLLEMGGFAQTTTNAAKHANPAPPALPAIKPPVEFFRTLLAMSPAQQQTALTNRTPEQKKIVVEKLREYEAMTPVERELRLRHTELRWYLVPLMRLTPVERIGRLESIPAAERSLVESRLQQWDEIPPHLQKEFLENEGRISYFLRMESTAPEQQEQILNNFPKERREKLEKELAEWRALPDTQRKEMCDRFQQFFELSGNEKQKVLGTFDSQEREQMEKTLKKFERLPTTQRHKCIDSFRRFANFTPEERDQFLHNAERWQAMSPAERTVWRELVEKTPNFPPMPPGFTLPTRKLKLPVVTNSLVTNNVQKAEATSITQ